MPMHLKLEGIRNTTLSQVFLFATAISVIILGTFLLNAMGEMSVRESLIIVSAPVGLALALIWSVHEIKRLNP